MPKKCRICKKPESEWEYKYSTTQVVCSVQCAVEKTKQDNKKAWNKEKTERKEKLKSLSDHLAEVQKACNAYIRKRDEGHLCISCQKPPKKKNAGHYKSVGSHPELRFEEDNIHLQCEYCNTYLSGNQINYRENLIKKIGLERVEWLEGPHKPKKYTIERAKELKKEFKEKLKNIS